MGAVGGRERVERDLRPRERRSPEGSCSTEPTLSLGFVGPTAGGRARQGISETSESFRGIKTGSAEERPVIRAECGTRLVLTAEIAGARTTYVYLRGALHAWRASFRREVETWMLQRSEAWTSSLFAPGRSPCGARAWSGQRGWSRGPRRGGFFSRCRERV